MARRYRSPFNAKRYIGNKRKNEVHDLDYENRNCQIDEIKTKHIVTFVPDSLEQVHLQGFNNCDYCIGGSSK